MKNKLVLGLAVATGAALLVLAGILIGGGWNSPAPQQQTATPGPEVKSGQEVSRKEMPNPPPAPEPVKNDDRVKQVLKVGKTYDTVSKGTMTMRGSDKDWGVATTITIAYAFNAEVERTIEKNDGATIVELRRFKKVESLKIDTKLEDFRLELGAAGDILVGGVALLKTELVPFVVGARKLLEGNSLTQALQATGLDAQVLDHITRNDPAAKMFTQAGDLQGKTVRISYQNRDGGDTRLQPVDCTLSDEEARYLAASVLLTDALVFPDMEVKVGAGWWVNGANLIGLMDPSMLAYTDGKVYVERGPDEPRPGKSRPCVQLQLTKGDVTFRKADPKADQVGYFRPRGTLTFSPQDQIIIEGEMKGSANLEIQSKNHLLFEARSTRTPEMTVRYFNRIREK